MEKKGYVCFMTNTTNLVLYLGVTDSLSIAIKALK